MAFTHPLSKLSFAARGWITLASGFLVHFTLGTFYLWGSVISYTTSYMQQHGTNVTKDDAGAVFPFTFLAMNFGIGFGVDLARRFGHFKYLFVCSFLSGLSMFISSFVIANFALFILFYSVIFGLLTGIIYMVPFNTCFMYFPTRRGLVSGVITAGFGFGSAVFIWLIYGIVNPHGLTPSQKINGGKYYTTEVTENYPASLRALAYVILGLGCLSSFFHIRPTMEEAKIEEQKLLAKQPVKQELPTIKDTESGCAAVPQLAHKASSTTSKTEGAQNNEECSPCRDELKTECSAPPTINSSQENKEGKAFHEFNSIKEGLQTKFIWLSILLGFTYTAYGSMIVSQYKNYGEYCSYNDTFLSAVGTVGSIINGGTRLFWGTMFQYFSFKQLITANMVLQMIVSFTFRYVASNSVMFFIYIQLEYFLYGGWPAIWPVVVARVYGKKIGTSIYCFTWFGFAAASFLQYFLVKDLKNSIGWGGTFWVFSAILLFGQLLTFVVDFHALPPKARTPAKMEAITTENAPIVA